MFSIEASRAVRASAICRIVSGEWGRVEGEVEAGSEESGPEALGPGMECDVDGALVLVEADADAVADILGGRGMVVRGKGQERYALQWIGRG